MVVAAIAVHYGVTDLSRYVRGPEPLNIIGLITLGIFVRRSDPIRSPKSLIWAVTWLAVLELA